MCGRHVCFYGISLCNKRKRLRLSLHPNSNHTSSFWLLLSHFLTLLSKRFGEHFNSFFSSRKKFNTTCSVNCIMRTMRSDCGAQKIKQFIMEMKAISSLSPEDTFYFIFRHKLKGQNPCLFTHWVIPLTLRKISEGVNQCSTWPIQKSNYPLMSF